MHKEARAREMVSLYACVEGSLFDEKERVYLVMAYGYGRRASFIPSITMNLLLVTLLLEHNIVDKVPILITNYHFFFNF